VGKGSSFAPENTPVTIGRFVPGMQRFALDWRQDVKQKAVEHHFAIWRRRLVNAVTGKVEFSPKSMSGNPTRELTRNRRVGQRERSPHESFSLVSPYSSGAKPREDSPS